MDLELRRRAVSRPIGLEIVWRQRLLAAYLAALAPALVMAFTQPVWSRVDEAQHADFVSQLAHGVYPVEARSTLQPEVVRLMRLTGVYRWDRDGQYSVPAEAEAANFASEPSGLTAAAQELWFRRHLWRFSYEAMQPPLFYVLAAPVWALADNFGGLAAVYMLRLLNALVLALLAPLALLAARLAVPGSRPVEVAAVLGVAVLPGLVLNGSAVSNDTLAAVLACVALLVALRSLRLGWTWRAAALAGGVCGLALLTKLTVAGVLPALALAHLWNLREARAGRWPMIGKAALTLGLPWLLLVPWLGLNLHLYGRLMPTGQARELLSPALTARPFSLPDAPLNLWMTFWTGEPLNTLPAAGPELVVALAWTLAAIAGACWIVRACGAVVDARVLAVCGSAVVGAAVWAPASLQLSHVGGLPPGRYVYPAVVPLVVILVAGTWALGRTRALGLALSAYVLVSAMNIGGFAAGWTGIHSPQQPDPSTLMTVSGWGRFDGVVLTIDEGGVDPQNHQAWVHVDVRNTDTSAAELWMTPHLLRGSHAYRALPAAGSSFPERLAPGAEASGWLAISGAPAGIFNGPLYLRLDGVATGGYRDVGSILFPLSSE